MVGTAAFLQCLVLAATDSEDEDVAQHVADVTECIIWPALADLKIRGDKPPLGRTINNYISDTISSYDIIVALLYGKHFPLIFNVSSAIVTKKPIILLRHRQEEKIFHIDGLDELTYDLAPQSVYSRRYVSELAEIIRRRLLAPGEKRIAPQKRFHTVIDSKTDRERASGEVSLARTDGARLGPSPDQPSSCVKSPMIAAARFHPHSDSGFAPPPIAKRSMKPTEPEFVTPPTAQSTRQALGDRNADNEKKTNSCIMTHGLYLKANLEMPCWDDAGEEKILRQLDSEKLSRGDETKMSSFDALLHIRESFSRGKIPYPGVCERCAVLSHGRPVTDMRPRVLEVLHVEPSYLCHLSCPQCVPPKLRKTLKSPPYHLEPNDYDAFLAQLRRDGVENIKLVIFEGRGDPLNNKNMGELVKITKNYFPDSFTSITTHGNFPFKRWMMECGLDLLRLSVDGAIQENYAKYRIGGRLDSAIKLMRDFRDFPQSRHGRPSLEWKYILFEWNDSDGELSRAAKLAIELQVGLRFTRTHTPGRSRRYTSARDVRELIARLAPDAKPDLTFQLKTDEEEASVETVRDDNIEARFKIALQHLSAGDTEQAQAAADDALALDKHIERPITAIYMANYAGRIGNIPMKITLMRRYLKLLPSARDYDNINSEILLYDALAAIQSGDVPVTNEKIGAALAPRFGFHSEWLSNLSDAVTSDEPYVVSAMANIARETGDLRSSAILFRRYLELAPHAVDRDAVLATLNQFKEAVAAA